MVVGGDGSVNEIVNGIAGRDDVEIAVIARGTGWDFARSLGLPHGVDQAIDVAANDTTKALGGKVSYVWATFAVFARWSNTEVEVTVDGQTRRAHMHDVVVANGPFFGGGMKICPGARVDDGAFDVLLIGDLTKSDLLLTLPKTFRGKHLPHPKAELLRGAHVTVHAAEALPLQLDGEQPGTTPARFELVSQALRVRVSS